MTGELLLHTSSDVTVDFSCGGTATSPCRWGDYAGASTDLAADVVWGTNMLSGVRSGSNPAWRTRNFALSPSTSTVGKSGSTITFAAQQDVNNNVTVTLQAGFYHFKELVATAANVGGCSNISQQEVRCSAAGVTQINLSVADRQDTLTYTAPGSVPMGVDMGDGDDSANITNGHADTINCGNGTDTVTKDAADGTTNCSP